MLNRNEDYSQELIILGNNQSVGGTLGHQPTFRLTIDQMIKAWLHAKFGYSESKRTEILYSRCITAFREVLQSSGYDLDSDPSLIATIAQGWAAQTLPGVRGNRTVGPATFNSRICMLSSFYIYAIKHGWMKANPMQMLEKRKVDARDYARPMQKEDIDHKLAQIDRSTLIGKRDYALLSLALTTGRRRAELLALRWGDIRIDNRGEAIVIWRRCKGGKVMEDQLQPGTLTAILDSMHALYGPNLSRLAPDTPIWVSHANGHKRQPLTTGIGQIWLRRLGTTKVHSSRHTFAIAMEEAGAKLSDIGARLGHSNLATTSIYMQRLHKAENPYGSKLEAAFGIEGNETQSSERILNAAERVDLILQEHPELTNVQIASMADASTDTVRRHRKTLGIPPSTHFRQK